MIISTENKIVYLGNGITTEWPYSFAISKKSDMRVALVNLAGEINYLTQDYYVDTQSKKVIYPGYEPGQEPDEVSRPPILPNGWKLVLVRRIEVTQETDLGNNWPFPNIENMADKLTMIIQDLKEEIDRGVKVDIVGQETADQLLQSIFDAKASSAASAQEAQKAVVEAENAAAAAADEAVANVQQQIKSDVEAAQTAAQTSSEQAAIATEQAENARYAAALSNTLHILQRNTTYVVGDIAYSPLLPSWARLECAQDGTTDSTDITIPPNLNKGMLIPDGNTVFLVTDIRDSSTVGGYSVGNAANQIPFYSAEGHLILPSGAEIW